MELGYRVTASPPPSQHMIAVHDAAIEVTLPCVVQAIARRTTMMKPA